MLTLVGRAFTSLARKPPVCLLLLGHGGAGKTVFIDAVSRGLSVEDPPLSTTGFYRADVKSTTLWEIGGCKGCDGYSWAEGLFNSVHVVLLVVDASALDKYGMESKELLNWAYGLRHEKYTPIFILFNRCHDIDVLKSYMDLLEASPDEEIHSFSEVSMVLVRYSKRQGEGDIIFSNWVEEQRKNEDIENEHPTTYEDIVRQQKEFSKMLNIILSTLKKVRKRYEGGVCKQRKLRAQEEGEYEKACQEFRRRKIMEYKERMKALKENENNKSRNTIYQLEVADNERIQTGNTDFSSSSSSSPTSSFFSFQCGENVSTSSYSTSVHEFPLSDTQKDVILNNHTIIDETKIERKEKVWNPFEIMEYKDNDV